MSANGRLETFCDGVFAIAITLLILDIKVPPYESVSSVVDLWRILGRMWPSFFALLFSFTIILVSWVAHHNMLRKIDKTSQHFLFANGFYMLTVIFIPFPTAFMAEYLNTPLAQPAIVVYSLNSILSNIGWIILGKYSLQPVSLAKNDAGTTELKRAWKNARYGFYIYVALTCLAFWMPIVSLVLNMMTWLYWLYLAVSFKE